MIRIFIVIKDMLRKCVSINLYLCLTILCHSNVLHRCQLTSHDPLKPLFPRAWALMAILPTTNVDLTSCPYGLSTLI